MTTLIVATAIIVVPAVMIVSIYFSERLLDWAAQRKSWNGQVPRLPLKD